MGWRDRATVVTEAPAPAAGGWRSRATVVPTSAPAKVPEGPSTFEAVKRGGVQGGTFGFGDELGGLEQTYLQNLANQVALGHKNGEIGSELATKLMDALGIETRYGPSGLLDTYRQARDDNRTEDAAAMKAHPLAFAGSAIVGGLATGGVGGATKTLPRALTAAALGTVASGGASSADLTRGEFGQFAKDSSGVTGIQNAAADIHAGGAYGLGNTLRAGLDVLGAGPAGAVLPLALGKIASKAAPGLKRAANALAVESLGTRLPQYRALEFQGATQPLGEELLAKNIIPWRGGAENIQQRAAAEMARQGQTIGSTLEQLDAQAAARQGAEVQRALPKALAAETSSGGLFPLSKLGIKAPTEQWAGPVGAGERANIPTRNTELPQAMAAASPLPSDGYFVRPSAVREKALQQVVKPLEGKPFVGGAPEAIAKEIDLIRNPADRLGFQETNDLLGLADRRIGDAYAREGSTTAEGLKQVRGILRGAQQSAAENLSPELAQQLTQAKMSYGNMARAAKISEDRALRNLANRDLAPSDYAAAIGTFLSDGAGDLESGAKGLLAGVAHKLVRERGNAFAANALDTASKAAASPALPNALAAAARSVPQRRLLVRALDPLTGRELGRAE